MLATIVAVLSWVLAACGGDGSGSTGAQNTQTPVPPAATSAPNSGGGNVIEVTLADEGGNNLFEPANFNFKVGEKVRIRLHSQNVFHTFSAQDLPTEEGQEINAFVNGGETVEIEFTPSQAGTFDLICLPHQTLGMTGTITVSQ